MANLVYFENWMDPIGPETISASSSIELMKMLFSDDPGQTWRVLETAHGYQCLPSTETEEQFYPSADFLTRCPNLLAISVSGAGYDMVDVDACTEAGVLVANQSGANAESVAQHVIGLMLSLAKQIIQTDRAIRRVDRNWTRWDYVGSELTGRTLGIIGLGKIGRRLSEIAKVFSMNVIAYDPYITDDDFIERGAMSVTLKDLMSKSDFVSINCPLTEETRGMIGEPEFDAMKPSAIFISTARGGIHDEVALENAIATKRLAGAGVDVFNAEPPAHDHPLMRFENVIASPHNAGVTTDCMFNMAKWAADQWINIFDGKRPQRFINPEVWPKFSERYSEIMGRPVAG